MIKVTVGMNLSSSATLMAIDGGGITLVGGRWADDEFAIMVGLVYMVEQWMVCRAEEHKNWEVYK